jgi:ribosome-associated protein
LKERKKKIVTPRRKTTLARTAAAVKKALDPVILKIDKLTSVADFFFICSAANERQVKAIVEEIDASLSGAGCEPLRMEGRTRWRWVVLDYGDVLIHVFLDELRQLYSLEKLWGDAPKIFPPDRS